MNNTTTLNSTSKEFYGLDNSVKKILVKYDILTLNDVISKKETELLLLPKMGPAKIDILRKWLNVKGLDLMQEFSSFTINLNNCKDLYHPIIKILEKNNIFTLEDLVSKTEAEIMQIKGFSNSHLLILKNWLKKHHLNFAAN